MRKIKLDKFEEITLSECVKNHKKHHVRQRCQAMLLSNESWSVPIISSLLKTRTRTIYSWMNNWEKEGIVGLFIKQGRGRKSSLNIEDKEIVELVKKKH